MKSSAFKMLFLLLVAVLAPVLGRPGHAMLGVPSARLGPRPALHVELRSDLRHPPSVQTLRLAAP